MTIRFTSLAIIFGLAASPSIAGPSGQHSAQSVEHSAQAASHGSAALVSGAATVTAVPIMLFGTSMAISGAALKEVGESTAGIGNDLYLEGTGQAITPRIVTPNGAPALD